MRAAAPLSVTQLNTYVRSLLDGDERLGNVFVCGEVSNFTNHYKSGHLYLSLKDGRCTIKAVMFAGHARRLRFAPEDGMRVLARGRVSLYEQTGQYQFYIEDMQPDGVGALNLAFEQLKNRLAAEGLFDASRKKPLPAYPGRIGVITSPTGAAVHDIVTVLARRWPLAEIVFCPVLVQGDLAAEQAAGALERMNRLSCADVVILGRGGGSMEDLWPFNEERLVRVVSSSRIPVISAVGHETDFTICDFAADLRAPTPSAAAELAVPDWTEVLSGVEYRAGQMRKIMEEKLSAMRMRLSRLCESRSLSAPEEQIALRRLRLDDLEARMTGSAAYRQREAAARLGELCGRLHALSPLAVLARGYAVGRRRDGTVISRAADLRVGEALSLLFQDGEAACTVASVALSTAEKKRKEDGHEQKHKL